MIVCGGRGCKCTVM